MGCWCHQRRRLKIESMQLWPSQKPLSMASVTIPLRKKAAKVWATTSMIILPLLLLQSPLSPFLENDSRIAVFQSVFYTPRLHYGIACDYSLCSNVFVFLFNDPPMCIFVASQGAGSFLSCTSLQSWASCSVPTTLIDKFRVRSRVFPKMCRKPLEIVRRHLERLFLGGC